MAHKYSVGQLVHSAAAFADRTSGVYEILRLMPENRGEFSYRIKNMADGAQRAVGESEIRALESSRDAVDGAQPGPLPKP